MLWLPCVRVQLFTNWNCCSLSVNGQLQRPTFRPSPKPFEPLEPEMLPAPLKMNPERPPVSGGPAIPVPELSPGSPSLSIGDCDASEYAVCGLYLKYPKRKSVSHFVPKVFVKPVAKL